MDKFIVREPRAGGTDIPQRNMLAYTPGTNKYDMVADTMYFGGYGAEFPNQQPMAGPPGRAGPSNASLNSHYQHQPNVAQGYSNNHAPESQMASGIDPRYLAVYNDTNAAYIAGQRQQMERNMSFRQHRQHNNQPINHQYIPNYRDNNNDYRDNNIEYRDNNNDYRDNNNNMTDRRIGDPFLPQHIVSMPPPPPQQQMGASVPVPDLQNNALVPMKRKLAPNENTPRAFPQGNTAAIPPPKLPANNVPPLTKQHNPNEEVQKEMLNQPQTRADKIKALQKTGPRVFSGPVEKVLKWHKALQDIDVVVFYEVVAKCVSVRADGGCAKNLVVRDDNGPAIQVVYYEIDFMLPELKPPCKIRVIGRMMPGTCRLHAFNVRLANSDDVATLSRRAAVAAHHVAKLCKEYGPNAA